MKCPHCQKEFNAGSLMGSAKTPKKTAAAKKRGEIMKKAFANQKKIEAGKVTMEVVHNSYEIPPPPKPFGRLVDTSASSMQERVNQAYHEGVVDKNGNVGVQFTGIAPKDSFTKDELKAMIQGRAADVKNVEIGKWGDVDLETVPHAPFDVNIEGEPHRVAQLGKRGLYLFYVGEDGQNPVRPLAPGELETLWEKRTK